MAFPTTSVLDDFNRANEGPPPSASWRTDNYNTASSTLAVDTNICITTGFPNGGGLWGTSVGADTEVFVTENFSPSNGQSFYLFARIVTPGSAAVDGYLAEFDRADANPGYTIRIQRIDNNSLTTLGAVITETGGAHVDGNAVGLSVVGSTLSVFIRRSGVWSAAIDTRTDSTYAAGGFIGFRMSATSMLGDDFGGGTVVVTATNVLAWIGAAG